MRFKSRLVLIVSPRRRRQLVKVCCEATEIERLLGRWPITEPKDLIKTLREAVKVVKSGKPALVDVVCQMR